MRQGRRRGHRDDPETGAFPGERVFSSAVDVRYALRTEAERAHALVVSFSAVHLPHEAPLYNMYRVLAEMPCHALFVLDDHGPRGSLPRPCWYLGRDRRFDVADAVCDLVGEIARELDVDRARIITCGSSKGGWAALYFAARLGAGHAVAGEPQAFLGRHLVQEDTYSIAQHIAGGVSSDDCDFLDSILFDAFREADAPPHVHLYCGRGSPYYEHDALPLVRFLQDLGVGCELELGDHANHVPDLGIHFPAYVTARVSALLDHGAARPSVAHPVGG